MISRMMAKVTDSDNGSLTNLALNGKPRGQCYKTFFVCDLRIFIIS
jgi:hypothetical protein